MAASTNSTADLPLGSHAWYFSDSSGCREPGAAWRRLNLHLPVPQPGRFCCHDGECINSHLVCDNFDHCDGGEDEDNCNLIKKSSKYNSQAPPTLKQKEGRETKFLKTEIHAFTDVLTVNDFDEDESKMYLTFNIQLRWQDKLLNFNFLKKDDLNNSVKSTEVFWKPDVAFARVFKKDDIDQFNKRFFVHKTGEPALSNSDDANPVEVYSGSENWIYLEMIVKGKFVCLFDNNENYPFGSLQTCSFNMFISGSDNFLTNLVADNVSFSGPREVGQYKIDGWRVEARNVIKAQKSEVKGLTYYVDLSRRNTFALVISNHLPTLLMNLINQATNYISTPDKYELIVTVNVTCMMVLATIYLSVSSSLPSTSGLKPIEWYLLSSLLYPFLVISVNILIQVCLSASSIKTDTFYF